MKEALQKPVKMGALEFLISLGAMYGSGVLMKYTPWYWSVILVLALGLFASLRALARK
jgi:hypothetical protein